MGSVTGTGVSTALVAKDGAKPMNLSVAEDRLLADVGRRKAFEASRVTLGRQLSEAGFQLADYHQALFQRRVVQRMLNCGINRVEDYVTRLQREPAEAQQLGCRLQRPQTKWFDDLDAQRVLPEVLEKLGHSEQPLQIWLPGCGTGTEAHLLAGLAARVQIAARPVGAYGFTVYGTDTDQGALSAARIGLLAPTAVAQMQRHAGKAYLLPRDGGFQVAPVLQRSVIFLAHDLTAPPPLFDLDLIICRGLLSNFSLAMQRQLLNQMHAALHPSGMLLVGGDGALIGHEDLFDPDLQIPGLYRRSTETRLLTKHLLPPPTHFDERHADAYRRAFHHLNRPALFLDRNLDIVDANAAASALTAEPRNRPAHTLLGRNLLQLFVEVDRQRVGAALHALGASSRAELSGTLVNGHEMLLQIGHLGAGALSYFIEYFPKPGARRDTAAARDSFIETALSALNDALIALDDSGRIVEFSPSAEQMTGWTRAETLGQPCTRVLRLKRAADGEPADLIDMVVAGRGLPARAEAFNLQHRDGRSSVVGITVKKTEVGAVLILEDVSEIKLLTDELAYRANHDELTGLLNRNAFENRCRAALDDAKLRGTTSMLCYVDVDQFKVINDTLGHIAGDELLHALAGVLRARIRENDALARLSGDEFGVLLVATKARSGRAVVDALMETARNFRFVWNGVNYAVTISIGAAVIDASSENITRVMSLADAACFVAKDAGRDRARFADDDDELSRRHIQMSLVGKIGQALDEERFVLHYENVINIAQPDQIVYRELLIRMRDDSGKLLTPSGFIQAAERYFLMSAVDRWVLRQTFNAVARLPQDNIIYALNLSGQSLGDDKFLDNVLAELDRSGVDPTRICFEITETAAVSRLSEAVRFINCVSDFGCRFALDDFGAGMSSFSYLKNFRVNFLKIDGSFVRTILGSRTDRRMVESINRIGHELGLKTIAEHVESDALMEPLREIGVDWAQGRSISWSEPFEDLYERRIGR